MLCGHRGEGLVARVRKNERSQGDLKPTALGNPCLPAVPLDHTALEESGPGGGEGTVASEKGRGSSRTGCLTELSLQPCFASM